ncbi:Hypothetical protein NGAL_HAMBI2566_60430 [Neorhizobium galegae bv. orientalis]|nr:Hypothetical protein NGAL_HAMBI2566_60430 [Neorhizobium galegae bv. orientalis]CDZ73930.1 Hypothetical protein NGAL_HAMBI2610_55620 [Neorhizobium galegae bv. orientalis]
METNSRDYIQPLGHIFADAMQAAAAITDQAFRFNDLLDTRKMGGQRAPIGGAWFGVRFTRSAVGLVFGMDGGDGCFQVLQREIELIGIGLGRRQLA